MLTKWKSAEFFTNHVMGHFWSLMTPLDQGSFQSSAQRTDDWSLNTKPQITVGLSA